MLAVVTSVTFGVATLFVILRVISRVHIARNFAADDWLIVVSWLVGLGFNIICWVALSEGFGSSRVIGGNVEQLTGDLYGFSILYVSEQSPINHGQC